MVRFNRRQGNKEFHNFSQGIGQKMNVIGRVEFELAYYEVKVQHFSHNAMRASQT